MVNEGGLGPCWVLEVLEAAKKLLKNIGNIYLPNSDNRLQDFWSIITVI